MQQGRSEAEIQYDAAEATADRDPWRHRASNAVATALCVSTIWHILLAGKVLHDHSLVAAMGICVVLGPIIALFRAIDRRWTPAATSQMSEAQKTTYYRHDLIELWLGAIAIPAIWVVALKFLLG